MGIIGIIAPDEAPLLALLSLVMPAITSGNTVVALASSTRPYPSILLGEMLATSDLPGGVVNLLTGRRDELVPTFATHAHLRGLAAVGNLEERKALQIGAADSVKRLKLISSEVSTNWYSENVQGLYEIRDHLEAKTTWHPIGA
jgi:aldehyde dehydrogenase (NAD+)